MKKQDTTEEKEEVEGISQLCNKILQCQCS